MYVNTVLDPWDWLFYSNLQLSMKKVIFMVMAAVADSRIWMVQSKLFWEGPNAQTTSSGYTCTRNGCRKGKLVVFVGFPAVSSVIEPAAAAVLCLLTNIKKLKDVLTVSWLNVQWSNPPGSVS